MHHIKYSLRHEAETFLWLLAFEGMQKINVIRALSRVLEERYSAFSLTCHIDHFVVLIIERERNSSIIIKLFHDKGLT